MTLPESPHFKGRASYIPADPGGNHPIPGMLAGTELLEDESGDVP